MTPVFFRLGIEPHRVGEHRQQTRDPGRAGFFVPMFDAATDRHDLVRTHGAVADKHNFVIGAVGMHDLLRRHAHVGTHAVVTPHCFINKVVEVVMFEMFELTARGREQLFAYPHVRIHRTADIEKQ